MIENSFPMADTQQIKAGQTEMKKFLIRYHLVDSQMVTEVKESENFGRAVAYASKRLQREIIGIAYESNHVIELKTKYVVYHEVMEA